MKYFKTLKEKETRYLSYVEACGTSWTVGLLYILEENSLDNCSCVTQEEKSLIRELTKEIENNKLKNFEEIEFTEDIGREIFEKIENEFEEIQIEMQMHKNTSDEEDEVEMKKLVKNKGKNMDDLELIGIHPYDNEQEEDFYIDLFEAYNNEDYKIIKIFVEHTDKNTFIGEMDGISYYKEKIN